MKKILFLLFVADISAFCQTPANETFQDNNIVELRCRMFSFTRIKEGETKEMPCSCLALLDVKENVLTIPHVYFQRYQLNVPAIRAIDEKDRRYIMLSALDEEGLICILEMIYVKLLNQNIVIVKITWEDLFYHYEFVLK